MQNQFWLRSLGLRLVPGLLAVACAANSDEPHGGSSDSGLPHDGSPDSGLGAGGDSGFGEGQADAGLGDGSTEAPLPDNCTALTALVRDFSDKHPDFENDVIYAAATARNWEPVTGIVGQALGPGRKPVYAATGEAAAQTTGADNFAQWYEDMPGVNHAVEIQIPLTEQSPGRFMFDSSAFFPLDDMALGNEGRAHNYHFTTEVHVAFDYRGGEEFTFTGDDDLFLFVNGKLAIDLGGIHPAKSSTVDFDAMAGELGIVKGGRYAMDIFHAERRTIESNFRVETSIECFFPIF